MDKLTGQHSDYPLESYVERDHPLLAKYLAAKTDIYRLPVLLSQDAAFTANLAHPVLQIDLILFMGAEMPIFSFVPDIELVCDEGGLSLARITHQDFIRNYVTRNFKLARIDARLLKYAWQGCWSDYYDYMLSKMQ